MRKSSKRSLSFLLAGALICTMLPVGSAGASAAGTSADRGVVKLSQDKKADEAASQAPESTQAPAEGTFGGQKNALTGVEEKPDSHKWSFDPTTGVLTISVLLGQSGDMPDYTSATYTSVPWYPYYDKVTKVVLQDGVTSIGDYTFYKYPALKEVDAKAESVIEIGASAFNASAVETVAGLEHIETFGASAFYNSALAGDLQLTAATELGSSAFYGTKITSVKAPVVQEPSGGTIFQGCVNLTSVDMEALTSLAGARVFTGCTALNQVNLPQLKTTGEGTFQNDKALQTISLPELTTLEGSTFSGTSVNDPYLPKVETAKAYAFDNDMSLTKISLPKTTEIRGELLRNCGNLMEIDFPQVTSLSGLPTNLSALVYFEIGENVTSITGNFLKDCQSFKRLYVKGDLSDMTLAAANIKENKNVTVYVKDASAKSKWTSAGMPEEQVKVEEDFGTLKKENKLRISAVDYDNTDPKNPEVTANDAAAATTPGALTYKYYKQTVQQQVYTYTLLTPDDPTKQPTDPGQYYVQASLPESDGYFDTTSNFGVFTVYGDTKGEGWKYNNKSHIFTITDKSLLETSYNYASDRPYNQYASSIEKIELGEGIKLNKVPPHLFESMSKVTDIPIEDTLEQAGASAFSGCSSWVREKPLTVKTIGASTFASCGKLTGTVTVAEGVDTLPSQAFASYGGAEVKLPESLRKIENLAFSNAHLKSLTIPDGVTTIGDRCFYGMNSLETKTIKLPASLTDFGSSMFYQAKSVETIEIPDSLTKLKKQTFNSATGLKTVHVPESVKIIEGTKSDNQGLFQKCSNLELVVFDREDYAAEPSPSVEPTPEAIFGKCGQEKSYTIGGQKNQKRTVDQTFKECPSTLEVVCDGDTYDLLKSYADDYNLAANAGWVSNKILHKPAEYKAAYDEVRNAAAALSAEDFDKDLFDALQETIKTSDEKVNGDATPYDKLMNYRKGQEDILNGVRAFLLDTFSKTQGVVEGDYLGDDSDGDAEDIWYAYEDARDNAESCLTDSTGITVDVYVEADQQLKEALAALKPLPTDAVAAELKGALDEAKALNQADYTEESWKVLQEQIAAAEEVIKNGKLISEFEEAQKMVEAAIEALEEAPATEAPATETPSEEPGTETTAPGDEPGTEQTAAPTDNPGTEQTAAPTDNPGTEQTTAPTDNPGTEQTAAPTDNPGTEQTAAPTDNPGTEQTAAPTDNPGTSQTAAPTDNPGTSQTAAPTDNPGTEQTAAPSTQATKKPSSTSKKKVTVKKVTLKKVSSKKKKTMVVQWKKLSGVTGYQIVIGLDKKMKKGKKTVTVKKAKTVKATIKKLQSKKKYFVKVRAYKTVSGKKYYGSYSKVKTVKVK